MRRRMCAMAVVISVFSFSQLASARFMVSDPTLKVIYGNITQIRDLAIPPLSQNNTRRSGNEEHIVYGDHEPLPEFYEYLDQLHEIEEWSNKLPNASDFDIKDLNEATKMIKDMKKGLNDVIKDHQVKTRRQLDLDLPSEIEQLYSDPVQLRTWYYMKLTLTYLIHIRFQVDTAIRYEMATVTWSGYKIGYLFQRLVRLKFQMYRLMEEWVSMKTQRELQHRQNWRTKKHSLKMFLNLYERALHLEVDMKDTSDMIKRLFYGRDLFVTELSTPKSKPLFK